MIFNVKSQEDEFSCLDWYILDVVCSMLDVGPFLLNIPRHRAPVSLSTYAFGQ